tara:strand:- start:939 stop:1991 length:1053 start_codon:yes stop_codon:yes gene_type:complete
MPPIDPPDEIEVVEESDDLRDSLEAAYTDEPEELDETEETPEGETTEEEGAAEGSEGKEGPEDGGPDSVGTPSDGVPPGINAPIGFSVESREHWKDVPQSVKQEIQKREQQITESMANTADARRTHSTVNDLANRYATILAAEGADNPMQAIEGLFRTVSELRVGSPQQVATKMANLIQHYGVDINMLDGALSGQPVESNEATEIQKMLDAKLAPFQELLSNQQTSARDSEQASLAAVNTELQAFADSPEAEFLNDVRHDMADLIDLASKRGQKLSFKEAYDKSCALNPSIAGVLAKRASDAALKNSGERLAAKKNVSSSLRASAATTNSSNSPQDLRGEISALWDSAAE